MRYSTVVITSFMAALATANMGVPAKRHIVSLSKRQDATCGGADGVCCDSQKLPTGSMAYTLCATGTTCKDINSSWCCCTDDKCTSCGGCENSKLYGDDFTCFTAGGKTFFTPKDQGKEVADAMAAPAGESAAASVLSEASASASALLASATEAAAEASSSAVAEVSGSIMSSTATPTPDAGGAAAGGATGGDGETGTNSTATGQPTATGPAASGAYRVIGGTPALALAILAGIFML